MMEILSHGEGKRQYGIFGGGYLIIFSVLFEGGIKLGSFNFLKNCNFWSFNTPTLLWVAWWGCCELTGIRMVATTFVVYISFSKNINKIA